MATAKWERTDIPGVYRRGESYVVTYRDGEGRARRETVRTKGEARKVKAARTADVARGEFHPASKVRLADYALEWVGRHPGLRPYTRSEYRRILEQFVVPHFGRRRLVSDLTPRDVAGYVAWLREQRIPVAVEEGEPPASRPYSDATVRNYYNPLRRCLATAMFEGLIRANPCAGVRVGSRPVDHDQAIDEDEEDGKARALSRVELAAFLLVVPARHRLLFRVLASTGLRISEAIALEWRDVDVAGRATVRVRRGIVRGQKGAPKTKNSRRNVPLPADIARDLRAHRAASEWCRDEDLVFPNEAGRPQHVENLRRRVLRPALEEAGAGWAGYHAFRHTCASMLFERGANVVQVSRWLGHATPDFTLRVYVHWLDRDDLGEPLDLALELPAAVCPVEDYAAR